ncbi:chemotaxis protein CheW [Pseudogulbenkiania sp. MAI-1]|uniref:chemotaxis protein CheW n=1 Tax=Pseudogulbenkiania sp. MAI-1 TaxID=990370 RepID=UPI00045E837D|nr:chemotaxis protein CheW [Pseudogulbenkiania sp. MAI-1]
MLFLLFQLGDERYVVDARQVVEVLPLLHIKRIPLAPPGVAGAFNYRGTPVPVVDLCQLALQRPAEARLSTRLIVVDYPDSRQVRRRLGLIAERVTGTLRRGQEDFVSPGISNAEAPYLGPVTSDAQGMVQWLDIGTLLPAAVRDVLYNPPVTA